MTEIGSRVVNVFSDRHAVTTSGLSDASISTFFPVRSTGGAAEVVVTIFGGGDVAAGAAGSLRQATNVHAAAYNKTMVLLTRLLLLVLALVWCESGAGRVRAVRSRIDQARRIVVITAHPDDEILIAPLLAQRCVRGGANCSIVVMTEGEGGGDAGVRIGEMTRAAALLNLRLTLWNFPDVMTEVATRWAAHAGDRATLVRQLRDLLLAERADMIFTFDPAHGTTGHPAHREIGALVLETGVPNIYLIETAAQFVDNGFALSNAAPNRAWTLSANDDWSYVVADAEVHASQFTPAQVESLRTLPPDQRKVWFAPH